jgi:hypothetical protein
MSLKMGNDGAKCPQGFQVPVRSTMIFNNENELADVRRGFWGFETPKKNKYALIHISYFSSNQICNLRYGFLAK